MSDSTSKLPTSSHQSDPLALTRISRWAHLAPDSLSIVQNELAVALGFKPAPTNSGLREAPIEKYSLSDLTTTGSGAKEDLLGKKIRHVVNSGAPWHVVSELLWQRFNDDQTPEIAAHFLETAFVHSNQSDTLEIFSHIMSTGLNGFYWHLHPRLRDFLVEHAPDSNLDQLYWIIAKERDATKLSGVEQAYIFLRLSMTPDKSAAWNYFRRNKIKILEVFEKSKRFGMTHQQIIYRVGELASRLGLLEESRELLQHLFKGNNPQKHASLEARENFDNSSVTSDRGNHGSYVLAIESANSWQERLAMINDYCDVFLKTGKTTNPSPPALDMLVKSILQWVPESVDAWRGVGDLLVRFRNLSSQLPNLFSTFTEAAVQFYPAEIDAALWSAALNNSPSTPLETFIHCTALLHRYVTNPSLGEDLLWKSYTAFHEIGASSPLMPWSWRDLMKKSIRWAEQTQTLSDKDSSRVLAALGLAVGGSFSNKDAMSKYCALCTPLPLTLLDGLSRSTEITNHAKIAAGQIITLGFTKPLTNDELVNLWYLAVRNPSPDLAWRTASVLAARDALPTSIKPAWEISGERRAAYTPITITAKEIECALSQLSTPSQLMGQALCTLGTKLNEYLLISGDASRATATLVGTPAIEQKIAKAVKESLVLPKPTKHVFEPSGIQMVPSTAAPLAHAIVSSPWIFAARLLAERLSVPAWGWNVNELQTHAKEILPLIGKKPSWRTQIKRAKWLTSLNSQERSAWSALVKCTHDDDLGTTSTDLLKFICRLALILYPSHVLALKTLQQIRMPIAIIQDLEWFILSDHWSALREHHKNMVTLSVPPSLRNRV
jgi:hypothetical protein